MDTITLSTLSSELIGTFLLSVGAFLVAMFLTPIYTFLAYRYKFWKRQRSTSTTGEKLEVFTKLHANKFKRNIPTMAGVITVLAVTVVTVVFNFDRAQTWLPLAALLGGGAVGLLDDIINLRGQGKGVAGLRSGLKFVMIIALAAILGWFFFEKLGYNSIYVPYIGDVVIGWWIAPLFTFAVVATGNAVNITDGLDGLAVGTLAVDSDGSGSIAFLKL